MIFEIRIILKSAKVGSNNIIKLDRSYSLSGPSALGFRDAGRDDGVAAGVEQLSDVGAEVGLGVAAALAGRRRLDARVNGRLATLPGRRERVGPAERQRLRDVGQRLAPGDALGPALAAAGATAASTAATAAATATHTGATPLSQYVGQLGQGAAPPAAADRRRRLCRLRRRRLGGDLRGRVPASAEPLLERDLLHLLAQYVVPSVAALPHQTHLVAEDRQVAHETYGCHRPERIRK